MKGWERPLDLLEAAYRLDGSGDDWMRELVGIAAKVFDREGLGAAGFVVSGRIDRKGRTVVAKARAYCGVGRALKGSDGPAYLRTYPHLPPDLQESLFFSAETASTVSVATGLGEALKDNSYWSDGGWDTTVTADALGLKCHEGPLHALVLGVALRKVTALTPFEQRFWQRVAAHIGAASRSTRPGVYWVNHGYALHSGEVFQNGTVMRLPR